MIYKFIEFANVSILLYLSEIVKIFGEIEKLMGITIQIIIGLIYIYNFIQDFKKKKNANK